ncbi:hypothetical protein B0H15DRAFT_538267 [Mycena belliarum]|uniref:Uncharacterized protein n=1 Tax=Mycena belliarum TaxID=1033014 RepID=A0AAD6XKX1_9AGAR|nr:hypothetical protein B0H15DRAFT_538267 [Mycena belliae]
MSYYGYNTGPSRAAPAQIRPVCHGLDDTGDCIARATTRGFCPTHQEQAVWLNITHISSEERRAHAEGRRCCGVTKKNALCRNNPGGNYQFCWLHGRQRGPSNVAPRPFFGVDSPERAIIRARMRELERLAAESGRRERAARDRWAQEEQQRREEARARAERDAEEHRRQREEEQRQQEERWHAPPPDPRSEWYEYQRSHQRQRRRNTRASGGHSHEEQRRQRDDRHEQQHSAQERARAEQEEQAARAAQDLQRGPILERYLIACATFDATQFSARNPNSFANIPWPVFARADGTVRVGDVTPANICFFFDANKMRRYKTPRERDVIVKRVAWRFHPDRFSVSRAVVATIGDLIGDAVERRAVVDAAEVVIKTVNGMRST